MSTAPPLPPLDPTVYVWMPCSKASNQWHRRLLGSETVWPPNPKDLHEMFIGGYVNLKSSTTLESISQAAKSAWRRLRFDVPELAVSVACGKEGDSHMLYEIPQSNEVVTEWLENTSFIGCGEQSMNFEELLERLQQKKRGRDAEQVFLFLNSVKDGDELVTRADFMLNADHQITDGIGMRILMGRFLALLAQMLSESSSVMEELNWQESVTNLSPPWISLINEEQMLSGSEYERVVRSHQNFLFQQMSHNPGLPLLSPTQPPTQKKHFIVIPLSQSTALLQSIKTLPSLSNITHLGHAAMVLALLRTGIPTHPFQTLRSPCWLNGRRYLKSSLSHPSPTKSYIPICQALTPVTFSDLDRLVLKPTASAQETREMLIQATREATEQYEKIKEKKSILTQCVVPCESVGEMKSLKQRQDIPLDKSSTTPSASGHETTDPHSDEQGKKQASTADPFFLSDGLTEQYISHSYSNREGLDMFEVEDIKFAANAEKNLIVRMSNWRGRVTISGEWREGDYVGGTVTKFLEDVVAIMLSVNE